MSNFSIIFPAHGNSNHATKIDIPVVCHHLSPARINNTAIIFISQLDTKNRLVQYESFILCCSFCLLFREKFYPQKYYNKDNLSVLNFDNFLQLTSEA